MPGCVRSSHFPRTIMIFGSFCPSSALACSLISRSSGLRGRKGARTCSHCLAIRRKDHRAQTMTRAWFQQGAFRLFATHPGGIAKINVSPLVLSDCLDFRLVLASPPNHSAIAARGLRRGPARDATASRQATPGRANRRPTDAARNTTTWNLFDLLVLAIPLRLVLFREERPVRAATRTGH